MQRADLSARYVHAYALRNRPALSGKLTVVFPAAYKLSRSAPADTRVMCLRSTVTDVVAIGCTGLFCSTVCVLV